MLRLVLILLLILPATVGAKAPVLLVLGDSLSAAYGIPVAQGWVSLLQQRLTKQGVSYDVVNASISGDTTAGGKARLPAALIRFKPRLVIIALGGNDGLRGFSHAETKDNLRHMIRQVRRAGAAPLLAGVRLPPNYGRKYAEEFSALFQSLEQEERVPLVPQLLSGIAERRELMQADGIHPRVEGQAMLLANVWPVLQPLLPQGQRTKER